MPKALDLKGQRFRRTIVIDRTDQRNSCGQTYWKCVCDCGKYFEVIGSKLTNEHTKSCGCFRLELSARRVVGISVVTHGHTRRSKGFSSTASYNTWHSMIQRCTNPKATGYRNYGGRGILVCSRWLSFENFLFDMGERPKERTLDRINVNGNYEPGNCRWATNREQALNKRKLKASAL